MAPTPPATPLPHHDSATVAGDTKAARLILERVPDAAAVGSGALDHAATGSAYMRDESYVRSLVRALDEIEFGALDRETREAALRLRA
jgi:hypothetical protein